MGNRPDADFTAGFTERLSHHSEIAYHLVHEPCKVMIPFLIDQVLVAEAILQDDDLRAAIESRAEDTGARVFDNPDDIPGGNVQVWRLKEVTDKFRHADVTDFVSWFRNQPLRVKNDDLRDQNKPLYEESHVAPNHVLIPAADFHECPFGPPHPHLRIELDPLSRSEVTVGVIDAGWQDYGPAQGVVAESHYGEWLSPDASGTLTWSTTIAAPVRTPTSPPRLAALAAHANFVAGVIAQACPATRISVESHNSAFLEAEDAGPAVTTEAAVARSLWNLRDNDLINVGFAFPTLSTIPLSKHDKPALSPPSWALKVVLDAMIENRRRRFPERDLPYILAPAGNQGCTIPQYPAAFGSTYENVIGVGSVANGGGAASTFSNHGPWVKCSAEGESVVSTFITFPGEAEDIDPATGGHPMDFHDWAGWSGTSFATPKVTGALACLKAKRTALPDAWDELIATSPSPSPAFDMGVLLVGLSPAPVP